MKPILSASFRGLLMAGAIASVLSSPAISAQIGFDSSVNKVTVYPKGAQVTRVAVGTIPAGEHVIVVNDLPGNVKASSIRVEGVSNATLEIRSVDIRREVVTTKDTSSERAKIEKQIEAKNDEIALLKEEITNAFAQRNLLQSLAGQSILPKQDKNGGVRMSAQELDAMLNLTATRFAAISKRSEAARIRTRVLKEEVDLLLRQVIDLAPSKETKTIVSINVAIDQESDAQFIIRYGVESAKWAPVYDAKLTLGKDGKDAMLKLVRRASVLQATAEKWDNVALTLSTARPSGRTQAPKLSPVLIREYNSNSPMAMAKKRQTIFRSPAPLSAEAPEDLVAGLVERNRVAKPKKAFFKDAKIDSGGYLAEFKIGGQVSVDNTGLGKNVSIGTREVKADIFARSVPKIDSGAYLSARFKIEGEAPWLPGQVILSRDGVYLGKTRIPLLNPGAAHTLGFGLDDFIKVERVQVKDKKGESGFISTSNVDERKFVTTVTNQHDFPVNVVIEDQVPYATHENIKVELIGNTKPSETNVGKKRGLLAWKSNVKAGEKMVIDFGYKVSWPKDMKISSIH